MESRRSFVKKSGGRLLSAALISTVPVLSTGASENSRNSRRKMHIGIIGAENSHTIGFGRVRISRNGANATATLAYDNGRMVTLIFKTVSPGWDTYAETGDGIKKLESRVKESDPPRQYTDMVEMFRTGREPRSHSSRVINL